ncbi:hypothetical protein EDD18DRAFT_1108858 [Armillaria luteobubalina]|uniref:Uncharacterized protein n=1 Tax=Armillaria luteobubalina TaxID=153913 RepID=A0AA39PXL4_9AGAR|nr:hypothetical protein EDD18DRAFT_1108858 [Armillaria luteobubalina]
MLWGLWGINGLKVGADRLRSRLEIRRQRTPERAGITRDPFWDTYQKRAHVNLSVAAIHILNEDEDTKGKEITVDFCKISRRTGSRKLRLWHFHSRYDYTFPTTMKLPNEERTLIFLNEPSKGVREGTESELEPGPDFDEDEWQEWFQAREEEDNVKKRAHGPVPKPRMISRKRKEVSEPGTAENSLQDGSAKVIGHPAKQARNKKT